MSKKAILVALLLAAIIGFYALGLDRYLSLAGLQARYRDLLALYAAHPVLFVACFMAIQILALALCLPGAVLSLSLAAGAIFGFAWGTVIVLCAITAGDSLGFLIARHLVRDWVERRFARQFRAIDRGVAEDGAFYLLALRLMAVVPYFVVNVTMALTRMPLRTFAPVSFVGLAPATAIYVNAGTALGSIRSAGDVLTWRTILSLGALGVMPVVLRWGLARYRARRAGP